MAPCETNPSVHLYSSIFPAHKLGSQRKLKLMMNNMCKYPSNNLKWTYLILVRLHSRPFFDKRMGQEVDGKEMGPSYEGYIFKITGGNDEDGFTMKQGILFNGRRRILFKRRKYLHSKVGWLARFSIVQSLFLVYLILQL